MQRGEGRGTKNEPFWFARAAFVLVYYTFTAGQTLHWPPRVTRTRALVCFSPISLLLVLARRLRVGMHHWVTYEEFRQETSRRESVPSVTFYTEEKGRKAEK